MPIYEYKCDTCGNERELLIINSEDASNGLYCSEDKCDGLMNKLLSSTSSLTGKSGREILEPSINKIWKEGKRIMNEEGCDLIGMLVHFPDEKKYKK